MGMLFGIGLALATAIGCVSYEHIVKNYPYQIVAALNLVYVAVCAAIAIGVQGGFSEHAGRLLDSRTSLAHCAIYLLTGVTSPLWYLLTRRYNVTVAGTFEIGYVALLFMSGLVVGLGQRLTPVATVGCGLVIVGAVILSRELA